MTLDGRAVANFLLDFCDSENRRITNLSLQKILYFCHVWSLIQLRKPLLRHQFEAWQYGPVLQYLYRQFQLCNCKAIVGRATRLDPITGCSEIVRYKLDVDTEPLLRGVIDFYSQVNASDLVTLTHVQGGPWDQVWNHYGKINPSMKIQDSLITEYYSKVRPPFLIQ